MIFYCIFIAEENYGKTYEQINIYYHNISELTILMKLKFGKMVPHEVKMGNS